MNIFDQYGIKEVADVTLYSIHKKKDGSGKVYYVPALFLDTLKISSAEKTAENVWAEGGLGNSRLICRDYGKQINVTLEDALCTPSSFTLPPFPPAPTAELCRHTPDAHHPTSLAIRFARAP